MQEQNGRNHQVAHFMHQHKPHHLEQEHQQAMQGCHEPGTEEDGHFDHPRKKNPIRGDVCLVNVPHGQGKEEEGQKARAPSLQLRRGKGRGGGGGGGGQLASNLSSRLKK